MLHAARIGGEVALARAGPGVMARDMTDDAARTGLDGSWANGPCEIWAHAWELSSTDSDRNRRIAYVLTDNATELGLRTYLTLPHDVRGGPERIPNFGPKNDNFYWLRTALVALHGETPIGINM